MSEGDKHDIATLGKGVLTECGYHVYLPQTYVSLPNVSIMFISLRHRCPYRMWLSCLSPSNIGVLTECGYQ
jgi:hypothetical protein